MFVGTLFAAILLLFGTVGLFNVFIPAQHRDRVNDLRRFTYQVVIFVEQLTGQDEAFQNLSQSEKNAKRVEMAMARLEDYAKLIKLKITPEIYSMLKVAIESEVHSLPKAGRLISSNQTSLIELDSSLFAP